MWNLFLTGDMSFLLQFKCYRCGYLTDDTNNTLIDPLGMSEWNICSCNQCTNMFHRKSNENKEPINRCTVCESYDITIHENIYDITCPSCGKSKLSVECIGTAF